MSEVKEPVLLVSPQANKLLPLLPGYSRVRKVSGAIEALQDLETNQTRLVISHYHLDDMDGLELADSIRDIDSEEQRHYIILICDDITDTIAAAVGKTIDLVLLPSQLSTLLEPSARQALRIMSEISGLLTANEQLRKQVEMLNYGQLLDPLTGLGNRKMAEQSLSDNIRQIESRGGAVCFLLIAIGNYDDIKGRFDERIAEELVKAVSDRLGHLVRPLDVVTYFETGMFALILNQPSIEHCTADCYKRIYDGLRLRAFSTRAGFLDAEIAISICASEAQTGAPNPNKIIKIAQDNLLEARVNDTVMVHHMGEHLDL